MELEMLHSKEIKSKIISPSMKKLMSTKGVPLIDIDDFKSELACGDFSQLTNRSFQTLGEVNKRDCSAAT